MFLTTAKKEYHAGTSHFHFMAKKTKKPQPSKARSSKAVLYAVVDASQHTELHTLAFLRGTSLADLVREALTKYLVENGPSAEEVEDVVRRLRAAAKGAAKTSR